MTIYWFLLAVPAVLSLLYPARLYRGPISAGQAAAMAGFVVLYTAISLLRHEVGGDWSAYVEMFDQARVASFGQALVITDPAFSFLLWLSALLGAGIYLPNAICSLILCYGICRVAARTKEPWLAILVAVPYLLIVVGLGYIRQAAAIGLVLLAIDALVRERRVLTLVLLLIGATFHSTSVVTWPLFAMALANRNKLRMLILAIIGSGLILLFALPRYAELDSGYLESEYNSGGALVRLLMGLVPSVVLLARWRAFEAPPQIRSIWFGFAVANIIGLLVLLLSPSSTAVDRLMLYFSAIQVVVFGELAKLLGFTERSGLIVRFVAIAYAVTVQLVWLLYATHSDSWVPYKSVLTYL